MTDRIHRFASHNLDLRRGSGSQFPPCARRNGAAG